MWRLALARLVLVVILLGLPMLSGAARAERRVALVIGNNDYKQEVLPDLNNASRDAEGIAARLKALGFDVELLVNADKRAMFRAISRFERRLAKADVGLAFYAGHGIQSRGVNYMIPADAALEIEDDLESEAVDSQRLLDAMEAAGSPMNILIIDACRDNPLPQRTRSAARGLARQPIPSGVKGLAMLYSAGEGQVAQDGPPGGHGVFTGELLAVLEQPGLKIEEVFKQTAARVAERTGDQQDPLMTFNIKGDFIFVPKGSKVTIEPATAPATATPAAGTDKEVVFWKAIENSDDAAEFQAYLKQFPEGTFAPLARARVKALASQTAAQPATAPAAVPLPGKPGETFRDCPDCPEMTVIPAGRFTMGSDAKEQAWAVKSGSQKDWVRNESPQVEIAIAKPFAMGKFEITRGQFAAFLKASGHQIAEGCNVWDEKKDDYKVNPKNSWRNPGFGQIDSHPAVCIDWYAARAYVKWLSEKTGARYRLPSEAEWEYAARAGGKTMRYWGDDLKNNQACKFANVADMWDPGFKCQDGFDGTAPVGRGDANAFGLHDMLGNAWEWVEDCYNESHEDAPVDGTARQTGDCSHHPFRGGSFDADPWDVRAAVRGYDAGDSRIDNLGFRVLREQ